jgi:hypothetical protein
VLLGFDPSRSSTFNSIIDPSGSRTRFVSNSSDLPRAFLDFPTPAITGIYEAKLRLRTVDGAPVAPASPIALRVGSRIGDRCWDDDAPSAPTFRDIWCLEHFPLQAGKGGEPLVHEVTLRAQTNLNGTIGWQEVVVNVFYKAK